MNLILGTAMWGWTLTKERCFELLDAFYAAGGRSIDTATNYPINKEPADFRKAEKLLQEWLKANQVKDLKIIAKVGSINNMMSPEHNLSKSFLLLCLDQYLNRFGENLETFMVHWDNRNQVTEIEKSWQAMELAQEAGLKIGLSGIKFPTQYKAIIPEEQSLTIQVKHNVLYSDWARYEALHSQSKFIAYGINAGGLKLNEAAYSSESTLAARGGKLAEIPAVVPKLNALLKNLNEKGENDLGIQTMNHIGLIYALQHPGIHKVLIGPSRLEQLKESIHWEKMIRENDFTKIFEQIKAIADA